jgi:hypothetical protein
MANSEEPRQPSERTVHLEFAVEEWYQVGRGIVLLRCEDVDAAAKYIGKSKDR